MSYPHRANNTTAAAATESASTRWTAAASVSNARRTDVRSVNQSSKQSLICMNKLEYLAVYGRASMGS